MFNRDVEQHQLASTRDTKKEQFTHLGYDVIAEYDW
jgi:hypothetical protein